MMHYPLGEQANAVTWLCCPLIAKSVGYANYKSQRTMAWWFKVINFFESSGRNNACWKQNRSLMVASSCSKLLFTNHIFIVFSVDMASLRESALKTMPMNGSLLFDLSVATKEKSLCMEKILQLPSFDDAAKCLLSGEEAKAIGLNWASPKVIVLMHSAREPFSNCHILRELPFVASIGKKTPLFFLSAAENTFF